MCSTQKPSLKLTTHKPSEELSFAEALPYGVPFPAGSWVLYWTKKSSPNRLKAAGRWHGPAEVICQEGQSIVWVAHGTTILRCAPENLRPASLRERQQLSSLPTEEISRRAGGASAFLDLTGHESEAAVPDNPERHPPSVDVPTPTNPLPQSFSAARESNSQEDDVAQPEQDLTPQVSCQGPENLDPSGAPEVERGPAAPSVSTTFNGQETPVASELPAPSSVDASLVPVPESDEGLLSEQVLLASKALMGQSAGGTRAPEFCHPSDSRVCRWPATCPRIICRLLRIP